MTESTKQSCGTCYCFAVAPGTGGNGMCRLAPPTPLVVGMQQVGGGLALAKPQGVQPIIQGVQGPTAVNGWCAQWRPRTYEGDAPEIPAARSEYRT